MSRKKIVIASISLALILAVGGGVHGQTIKATEKLDLSKIPEPKLVAEYKYDSPISDAVFYDNGKPKVVATEAYIRFYNPDGSIRKEIKTKDIKHREGKRIVDSRETAQISKNGEYVAVMHNVKMGIGWVKYLDRNGRILFERFSSMGYFWVSPMGDYLIFSDNGSLTFINAYGKTINKHENTRAEKVIFSKDGKYGVIKGTGDNRKENLVMLFRNNGDIVKKHFLSIDIDSMSISADGNYYIVGGSIWSADHFNIINYPIYLFDRNGLILEKDDNGPNVAISPDGGTIYSSRLPRRYPYKVVIDTYFDWFALKSDSKGGAIRMIVQKKEVVGFIKCALLGGEEILICFLEKNYLEENNNADNAYILIYDRKTNKSKVIRLMGALSDEYDLIADDIQTIGKYLAIKGKKAIRVYQL